MFAGRSTLAAIFAGDEEIYIARCILFADRATLLPLPLRAKLLMALLGIVVLGIGLVVMIVLGARMVKRLARQRREPSKPLDDAWYRRPLDAERQTGPAETESDDR